MGRSSLVATDIAVLESAGQDDAALGPGDNSDSGSDRVGLEGLGSDDPVDRHQAEAGVEGLPGSDEGGRLHDDEDEDLAFIDNDVEALDPDVGDDRLTDNDGVDGSTRPSGRSRV